ncbi:MAG: peptidylprolyl isomerase [Bacteroidetes bacterium]|nr:MAG: peptidylprolyl isomerase [Bacteroidota bacterium]TAE69579.1 MAG: peptidylprolyl isomerase [Bacteroidota bacterium]TAF97334.1 MAG: peptidylprolyl isomerase [Bacteroidota bacterium]
MNKLLLVVGFTVAGIGAANAQKDSTQKPFKMVADKIIAQVGDKIILKSDIFNAIADYKRQGEEAVLPENPECAFLEGQLIQKALVLQANKDSLTVPDDELEAMLDNQIRGFIQAYGGKEQLEEIAGKSVYQIKEDLKEPFRERKLADQMRGNVLNAVKITPNEVKAYFEKIPKDSLAYYESELEVSQVILLPKANKDVEEYVTRELYELKRKVESGQQKFEALAKLYTEDPGSKETGGQYRLNRNDKQWDPTFFNAAFKLKEGQISPVIKSKFGFHIIQMVSRAGDDALIRHILRIPAVTDEEVNAAKVKLDSFATMIRKGDVTFGEIVNKHSDDEGSKFNGGAITGRDGGTYINIDQLDKETVLLIKEMKVGDVSNAVAYTDERGRKAVRIIYLKTRTNPHVENLRDDYNKISARALEFKKQTTLEKWFKEHLPNYFITIDSDFGNCQNIEEFRKAAEAAKSVSSN